MEKVIKVENVSKKYKLYNGTKDRLLDLFMPGQYGEDFYALRNVDFKAKSGEVIGFVGINGSGKSTLSNIIAGIVPCTTGSVELNGEVSLIAVAAGLKNDLTGRDNIELKLLMLGFNKKEIEELEPGIIAFAELEQFIDQPVKSYSSGMKSRLGFAISVSVDPEILVIDEALSVGDKAFAEKSLDKMNEFKQEGKTMIFVSHSIGQMKKFCDKILWLEFGRVKDYGPVTEILPKYEAFLGMWKKMSKEERNQYKEEAILNKANTQDFSAEKVSHQESNMEVVYSETSISRIGRINPEESFIYESPKNLKKRESSHKYKEGVYYIKKKATNNEELFYLLSLEPSAQTGVIGWIKAEDILTRPHVQIDEDQKCFYLNGAGRGYDTPWGKSKNFVFPDLKKYKSTKFNVEKTDRVGKGLWYYGLLEEERVWIFQKNVIKKD